jgi:hypothetical protein
MSSNVAVANAQELGRSSSARGLENIDLQWLGDYLIIHTFVIAEQIHGTLQTTAVGANPQD